MSAQEAATAPESGTRRVAVPVSAPTSYVLELSEDQREHAVAYLDEGKRALLRIADELYMAGVAEPDYANLTRAMVEFGSMLRHFDRLLAKVTEVHHGA